MDNILTPYQIQQRTQLACHQQQQQPRQQPAVARNNNNNSASAVSSSSAASSSTHHHQQRLHRMLDDERASFENRSSEAFRDITPCARKLCLCHEADSLLASLQQFRQQRSLHEYTVMAVQTRINEWRNTLAAVLSRVDELRQGQRRGSGGGAAAASSTSQQQHQHQHQHQQQQGLCAHHGGVERLHQMLDDERASFENRISEAFRDITACDRQLRLRQEAGSLLLSLRNLRNKNYRKLSEYTVAAVERVIKECGDNLAAVFIGVDKLRQDQRRDSCGGAAAASPSSQQRQQQSHTVARPHSASTASSFTHHQEDDIVLPQQQQQQQPLPPHLPSEQRQNQDSSSSLELLPAAAAAPQRPKSSVTTVSSKSPFGGTGSFRCFHCGSKAHEASACTRTLPSELAPRSSCASVTTATLLYELRPSLEFFIPSETRQNYMDLVRIIGYHVGAYEKQHNNGVALSMEQQKSDKMRPFFLRWATQSGLVDFLRNILENLGPEMQRELLGADAPTLPASIARPSITTIAQYLAQPPTSAALDPNAAVSVLPANTSMSIFNVPRLKTLPKGVYEREVAGTASRVMKGAEPLRRTTGPPRESALLPLEPAAMMQYLKESENNPHSSIAEKFSFGQIDFTYHMNAGSGVCLIRSTDVFVTKTGERLSLSPPSVLAAAAAAAAQAQAAAATALQLFSLADGKNVHDKLISAAAAAKLAMVEAETKRNLRSMQSTTHEYAKRRIGGLDFAKIKMLNLTKDEILQALLIWAAAALEAAGRLNKRDRDRRCDLVDGAFVRAYEALVAQKTAQVVMGVNGGFVLPFKYWQLHFPNKSPADGARLRLRASGGGGGVVDSRIVHYTRYSFYYIMYSACGKAYRADDKTVERHRLRAELTGTYFNKNGKSKTFGNKNLNLLRLSIARIVCLANNQPFPTTDKYGKLFVAPGQEGPVDTSRDKLESLYDAVQQDGWLLTSREYAQYVKLPFGRLDRDGDGMRYYMLDFRPYDLGRNARKSIRQDAARPLLVVNDEIKKMNFKNTVDKLKAMKGIERKNAKRRAARESMIMHPFPEQNNDMTEAQFLEFAQSDGRGWLKYPAWTRNAPRELDSSSDDSDSNFGSEEGCDCHCCVPTRTCQASAWVAGHRCSDPAHCACDGVCPCHDDADRRRRARSPNLVEGAEEDL